MQAMPAGRIWFPRHGSAIWQLFSFLVFLFSLCDSGLTLVQPSQTLPSAMMEPLVPDTWIREPRFRTRLVPMSVPTSWQLNVSLLPQAVSTHLNCNHFQTNSSVCAAEKVNLYVIWKLLIEWTLNLTSPHYIFFGISIYMSLRRDCA
jgi:hypothetical protein